MTKKDTIQDCQCAEALYEKIAQALLASKPPIQEPIIGGSILCNGR